MDDLLLSLEKSLESPAVIVGLQVAAIVLFGFITTWALGLLAERLLRARTGAAQAAIVRRVVNYAGILLVALSILRQFGVDLSVLLGAAGILTVAIGFASQTSASNVISGLFLLGERPFVVGDIVTIGTTTGELVSIDLLSVKIRTFDNLLVRMPNELLLKQPITNLTRYPIRRLDVLFGISYHEDVDRVAQVLREVAEANPLCLEEPQPVLMPQTFGEFGLNVQFSVWVARESFFEVRKAFHRDVLSALRREGIELPYPHRALAAAEASAPFPIRIVQDAGPQEQPPVFDGEGRHAATSPLLSSELTPVERGHNP